jgi:hypothetical protein
MYSNAEQPENHLNSISISIFMCRGVFVLVQEPGLWHAAQKAWD